MRLNVNGEIIEIQVINSKLRKTPKGERTLSIDFLSSLETAGKIKRGAEITMGKDIFVIEEAIKRHGGANKVSFSLYAEHITYKLLDYDMNGFIEDSKKAKKEFTKAQEAAKKDFEIGQTLALAEFMKTHTDESEINAFKQQQAQALEQFIANHQQASDEYVYKEKTAQEILTILLTGTPFTLGRCKESRSSIRFNAKTNKREILMQIVNNWQGELDFEGKIIHFDDKIGNPNSGYRFATGHNLKGIEVVEHKDGIKYQVDFAEIGRIDPLAGFVDIGDNVTVEDEAVGVNVQTRVIEIEYNPFQRKNTTVVLGSGLDYTLDYLEDMRSQEQYVEEKINDLIDEGLPAWVPPENVVETVIEKVEEKQTEIIQEVITERVISAETTHILNAWIKNLFVNNLETNFEDMMSESTAEFRNYISAKGMTIDFITESLGDELEDFKIEGRQIYYTAIGTHPEAYQYFTITDPATFYKKDETLTDAENEQKKQEFVEKFKVKRRKAKQRATKMKIAFEDVGGNLIPMIVWGQGDGSEHGQKCYMIKDALGFSIRYKKSNESGTAALEINDDGVRVFGFNKGGGFGVFGNHGQLRNIWIVNEGEENLQNADEGDVVFVIGGEQ